MQESIKITFYEPWMKSQVSILFESEYKVRKEDFETLMNKLYDHPYQDQKCIKLVALDGEKVVGFQSFFYWPYIYNNKLYKSFQSGNSITHPDYRGKGIFKRLLNFIFENSDIVDADFFVGFPVQASYNSFIKNGWKNILNLSWYIKLLNPFAFIFSKKKLLLNRSKSFVYTQPMGSGYFRLSENKDFLDFKNSLKFDSNNYFYYSYKIAENIEIVFEMKFQVRKFLINEVVIGKIYFLGDSRKYLKVAVNHLLNTMRKYKCVTFCSIAINEHFKNPDYKVILNDLAFRKINKEIFYIVKTAKVDSNILSPEIWDIGRADIDTW